MKIPVFSVVATTHDKLNEVIRIFNKAETEYYLWVQLPAELVINSNVYDVEEVEPNLQSINWVNLVDRDCNRPWLRIVFRILKDDVGLHVYKLSFINKHTDDVFQLYFGYVIQDDYPFKPYEYMLKERSNDDRCNICK